MSRIRWGGNLYGQEADDQVERERQLIAQQQAEAHRINEIHWEQIRRSLGDYNGGRFEVPQAPRPVLHQADRAIAAKPAATKEVIMLKKGPDGTYR